VQLRKMDHTALIVEELERSRRFYSEVLGLQEVPRPSNFTFGGSWFQGPGFQIHLILASDTSAPAGFAEAGEKDVRVGRAHHIAFEVEDVEKAMASLRAHDIEIVGGPQARGDGVTQFYIYDPDCNFLEFFSWDKEPTV
jgi:catechol 2,3-dioxygenase-like lactoylglutathione lyase family enzyme